MKPTTMISVLSVCATVLALSVSVMAKPADLGDTENYIRAPIPKASDPQKLSVSSSAGTTALTPKTVHSITCDVDVYWATGNGSAPTADSDNQILGKKAVFFFTTGGAGTSDYVAAVDTAGAAGSCWVQEYL